MRVSKDLDPNISKLALREGFRLISTRRVAIPVWRVDLQCRVLQTRKISATDEFVLRAIGLGIANDNELVEFLNLPAELVGGVLSELVTSRYVVIDPDAPAGPLALSKTGLELSTSLVEHRPVEKAVEFYVDGLSGDPIVADRREFLSAALFDETPHLVLEPGDEPDLDFGPNDTDKFMAVRHAMSRRDRDQDVLLSVISTEATTKRYRHAAGLLFQSTTDEGDFYLRICVDGRVREDLEGLLREQGVLEGLGLAARVGEDRNRVDRALGQDIVTERADDRVTEALREELISLGSSVTDYVEGTTGEVALPATSARAYSKLASLEVRRLSCVEAPEALRLSLAGGRNSILVSTSRLWYDPEHDQNVDLIRQLVSSGVAVRLQVPSDSRQMPESDRACLAKLKHELEAEGLVVERTKPSHRANFVVVDTEVAYLFAGSPFADLATSAVRFGDDRPTVVLGRERVRAFLDAEHQVAAQPT